MKPPPVLLKFLALLYSSQPGSVIAVQPPLTPPSSTRRSHLDPNMCCISQHRPLLGAHIITCWTQSWDILCCLNKQPLLLMYLFIYFRKDPLFFFFLKLGSNPIFSPSQREWSNMPPPYGCQLLSIYLTWLESKKSGLNEEAVQPLPSILDTQLVEGVTVDSLHSPWQNDEPVVQRWKTEQSVCCVAVWPLRWKYFITREHDFFSFAFTISYMTKM